MALGAIGANPLTGFLALGLGVAAVIFIILLFLGALIMWFFSRVFHFKKTGFGLALLVSVLYMVLSFGLNFLLAGALSILMIPIGYLLFVVLIKFIYGEEWGRSFLVGLVVWLVSAVVIVIISVILGIIFAAALIGGIAAGGLY